MLMYDVLALSAAMCWAVGGLIAVAPVRRLGPFAFSRWRMLMVALALWAIAAWAGSWRQLSLQEAGLLALSGLVGICVGDTLMFAALNRLGPRRTSILFSTHSAFSALLGYAVLGEHMSLQGSMGGLLILAGVVGAIILGRHKDEDHAWERTNGSPRLGVALGLLSALCQAPATLIAKPVMAGSWRLDGTVVDPIVASAIRMSVGCIMHFALLWMGLPAARVQAVPTLRDWAMTALNGIVAMGLGMTFILMALEKGDVGMVAILSSVTPVLVLPLLWWRLGRPPAPGAWLGAMLTIAGTALILYR